MDEPIVVRRPVGPPPFALRVAAVLAVPLLLYALVATGQKALENYRLNQEADGLRADIVSLRAQNLRLQQDIEQARTDAAIEALARQQLGLVKPGDHAIVVVSGPDATSAATTSTSTAPNVTAATSRPAAQTSAQERPTWRQWWDYFFG